MAVARPSAAPSRSDAAQKLERDETPLKARIPTSLHRKLKVYAFEHGTTMESIVLKGLEKLGFSADGKKVPADLE